MHCASLSTTLPCGPRSPGRGGRSGLGLKQHSPSEDLGALPGPSAGPALAGPLPGLPQLSLPSLVPHPLLPLMLGGGPEPHALLLHQLLQGPAPGGWRGPLPGAASAFAPVQGPGWLTSSTAQAAAPSRGSSGDASCFLQLSEGGAAEGGEAAAPAVAGSSQPRAACAPQQPQAPHKALLAGGGGRSASPGIIRPCARSLKRKAEALGSADASLLEYLALTAPGAGLGGAAGLLPAGPLAQLLKLQPGAGAGAAGPAAAPLAGGEVEDDPIGAAIAMEVSAMLYTYTCIYIYMCMYICICVSPCCKAAIAMEVSAGLSGPGARGGGWWGWDVGCVSWGVLPEGCRVLQGRRRRVRACGRDCGQLCC